jgi:hypothetical protein
MDIGNALRRAGREDITIRAVLANTISEVYQREVRIESVKIHGSTILIKTGKPLINSELSLLSEDIKKASLQKLDDMWIKLSTDITFRFM